MSAVANLVSSTFSTLFKGPKVPNIDIPGTPSTPRASAGALAERRRAGASAREGFEANILSGSTLGSSGLPPAQTAGRPLNATGGVKPNAANLLGG